MISSPVTADGKIDTLVELLDSEDGLSLVFVRTKRGADRLAQKLSRRGVDVVAMHGDMGQCQRERALERFRSGRARRSSPPTWPLGVSTSRRSAT